MQFHYNEDQTRKKFLSKTLNEQDKLTQIKEKTCKPSISRQLSHRKLRETASLAVSKSETLVTLNKEIRKKSDDNSAFHFNEIRIAFENEDTCCKYDSVENINACLESVEYQDKLKNQTISRCKECKSDSIHYDSSCSGIVCLNCGTINGKITNINREWQSYNKSKISHLKGDDRCGNFNTRNMPNAAPKMVLRGVGRYSLLGKIHRWSEVNYRDKNMLRMYKYMEGRCKDLVSQKTINYAFGIYNEIYGTKIFRGDIRKAILAACILYSASINNEAVVETELAKTFGISRNTVLQGNKRLLAILYDNDIKSTNIKPPLAIDFINKFCDTLEIEGINKLKVRELIENVQKYKLAPENNPRTKTTSCIFLMSCIYNLGITKKDISIHCKISEVTIYKCYTKLLEDINRIVDIEKLSVEQKINLEKLKSKRYKRKIKN